MKICIVGGVAGGASAAARLRRLDETAEIILFEKGKYISYANCGLPYHIGNVIPNRSALLLQTPEDMRKKYRIDVRTEQEVTAIHRQKKTLTIQKPDGTTYLETYDRLILSTGSSPIKPDIPGINSSRIKTLWTVPDADQIRAYIKKEAVHSTAVVGGGFIGLEMAENLRHLGLSVSLIEMGNQVLAPLDFEMAQLLHEHLEQNGISLYLNDGVKQFDEIENQIRITRTTGETTTVDLVILSVGIRPNSKIFKESGLLLNPRGGALTDAHLATLDPAIYAVGDVIEVEDFITKDRTMIPLAGPANKQGRIAADNIMGKNEQYTGAQGTSIVKVFDLSAASTGHSEKSLQQKGWEPHQDYETITIAQNSHAGYYPGAKPMFLKLLFTPDGKKILGAQVIGYEGVDKRIDVLSVAIRLGADIQSLKNLELSYAPPYSSAKDPVNMAGFTAENLLTKKVSFAPWDIVETQEANRLQLLDVREDGERQAVSLPGSIHIPLGQLRENLQKLDKTKETVVFCAIGVRAYNAARILSAHNFTNVKVYPGGMRFYLSTHYRQNKMTQANSHSVSADNLSLDQYLNCDGLSCQQSIAEVQHTMKNIDTKAKLEITYSNPYFTQELKEWCINAGNQLISVAKSGEKYAAILQKGSSAS